MRFVMARELFEHRLQKLQDDTLMLGSVVEKSVRDSVGALIRRDLTASRRVYENDKLINENRFSIEEECLVLIATQQPMARDLRLLAAILEIITELERIGDYSKGICRINLLMSREQEIEMSSDILWITDLGLDMLHRALGAFRSWDDEKARAITLDDNQVDALFNQIYRNLLAVIATSPTDADQVNYMLWAIHDLERLADRVTNICERVVFMATGEIVELDHSDDEWDWITPLDLVMK
jgi:phosphate transport system protein